MSAPAEYEKRIRELADARPPLTPERRARLGALLSGHIQALVDAAPPLTDEQRHKLASILNPASRVPTAECGRCPERFYCWSPDDGKCPTGRRMVARSDRLGEIEDGARTERVPIGARPTALYRHFDADGVLLYVGIAADPDARRVQHRHNSPWSDFIDRVDEAWFPNRSEARAAEKRAIQSESPLFNLSGGTAQASGECVRYLVSKDRLDLLKYGGSQ